METQEIVFSPESFREKVANLRLRHAINKVVLRDGFNILKSIP